MNKKYLIIVRNKIFATNLSLKESMHLSAYLGKKGIDHEIVYIKEQQND